MHELLSQQFVPKQNKNTVSVSVNVITNTSSRKRPTIPRQILHIYTYHSTLPIPTTNFAINITLFVAHLYPCHIGFSQLSAPLGGSCRLSNKVKQHIGAPTHFICPMEEPLPWRSYFRYELNFLFFLFSITPLFNDPDMTNKMLLFLFKQRDGRLVEWAFFLFFFPRESRKQIMT